MKVIAFVAGLILLLASCSEISYKEPQPKGIKSLSSIPEKLQGKYLIREDGEPIDTLVVESTGYRLSKDEVSSLSDSLVLKYYKGYYFFNSRDDFAWYLRIIQRKKNGDLIFMEMESIPENEDERKKFMEKLSKDIAVVETKVDDKSYYVIDPTPKKLIELIKKGYYKGQPMERIQ